MLANCVSTRRLVAAGAALLFVAMTFTPVQSQTADYALTDTAHVAEALDYDDGPHVLWQGDTTAVVFYLCKDEIVRETLVVHDTLHFHGLCADSASEYVVPVNPSDYGAYSFEDVARVLAVSDIHGEYEHFVNILRAAGAIDDDKRWSWGYGTLVIVGDVFDRGTGVTECLWLIHKLQIQARAAGGRVHMLLGNHELIVMRGDLRYVSEKYTNGIVKKTQIAYNDLYGPDMALGQWLRTCPAAVRIDSVLFVHAGLSPELIEGWNLKRLNRSMALAVDMPSPKIAFAEAAELLVGNMGPVWYRGYFEERKQYPRATAEEIDRAMSRFGVSAIVVGHTGIDSVATLYDGRVYAIDVDVEALGSLEALLYEGGRFWRIAGDGSRLPVYPYQEH